MIKTNMNKLSVVPVSRRKTYELKIEWRRIDYQDKTRMWGFKFRRSGYPRRIEDQARRASTLVIKLKRFKMKKSKTRVHLYKQPVLPIMKYPPIPTHALFKTRLQRSKGSRTEYWDKHIRKLYTHWYLLQKNYTEK